MKCARCTGAGAWTKALALVFCTPCAMLLQSGAPDRYWLCPVDRTALRKALSAAFGWCAKCFWPRWKCAESNCTPGEYPKAVAA